jgi:hypothetical protein
MLAAEFSRTTLESTAVSDVAGGCEPSRCPRKRFVEVQGEVAPAAAWVSLKTDQDRNVNCHAFSIPTRSAVTPAGCPLSETVYSRNYHCPDARWIILTPCSPIMAGFESSSRFWRITMPASTRIVDATPRASTLVGSPISGRRRPERRGRWRCRSDALLSQPKVPSVRRSVSGLFP